MIDFTSSLQICPYSFGNNPPQMVGILNIGDSPGFGGLMKRAKSTTPVTLESKVLLGCFYPPWN